MFTTDAILALIAVILFIAWIPHQIDSQSGNQIFENLSEQARDSAVINFYEENPGVETIDPDAEFGKCVVVYSIDFGGNIGSFAPIEKNVFCEDA